MIEVQSGRAPPDDDNRFFAVRIPVDGPPHLVLMAGELDLASRSEALQACTSMGHVDVVVDLAGLVFMDCAGYGALVESRKVLAGRGGSLVVTGGAGEPLRLLSLVAA